MTATAEWKMVDEAITRAIRASEDGGELDNEFSARSCQHPDCKAPTSAGARYACKAYVREIDEVVEYRICESCRDEIISA